MTATDRWHEIRLIVRAARLKALVDIREFREFGVSPTLRPPFANRRANEIYDRAYLSAQRRYW